MTFTGVLLLAGFLIFTALMVMRLLPGLFAFYGEKQLDLSGLASREQVFAVLEIELADLPDNETIAILAVR